MKLSSSLKEAWQINESMNQCLVEHLNPETLSLKTSQDGYSVAQHLAHMTEAKKFWGVMFDKTLASLPGLIENSNISLSHIQTLRAQSSQKLVENVEKASHKADLPYASFEVFLIQLITHDAHHRGQILLALKLATYDLPNEGNLWGLWREKPQGVS